MGFRPVPHQSVEQDSGGRLLDDKAFIRQRRSLFLISLVLLGLFFFGVSEHRVRFFYVPFDFYYVEVLYLILLIFFLWFSLRYRQVFLRIGASITRLRGKVIRDERIRLGRPKKAQLESVLLDAIEKQFSSAWTPEPGYTVSVGPRPQNVLIFFAVPEARHKTCQHLTKSLFN